ncbi:hypothetical protein Glove_281g54 [Diversispora epigaea]|uniref:Uncharacterized protein n=1 Tax=Diversispora epigaea TaxID=1348612 RepID=A0A397I9X1_9GLOM|nr:hypothetical protein Glove_281g54 [Diversispora epigaea]
MPPSLNQHAKHIQQRNQNDHDSNSNNNIIITITINGGTASQSYYYTSPKQQIVAISYDDDDNNNKLDNKHEEKKEKKLCSNEKALKMGRIGLINYKLVLKRLCSFNKKLQRLDFDIEIHIHKHHDEKKLLGAFNRALKLLNELLENK